MSRRAVSKTPFTFDALAVRVTVLRANQAKDAEMESFMAKRFITRIELTVRARNLIGDVSHANGMTQVATLSRVVQWFATQPDNIQAAILERYPMEIKSDIAKLLLERMALRGRESPSL